MNDTLAEGPSRSIVLELWWQKSRRAASGQNRAAVTASRKDSILTVVNILLPMTVFVIGICNSIGKYVQPDIYLDFADIITLATGFVLCISVLQFVGDYKVKSLEHKQASNEFTALAQEIEMTGFVLSNDIAFTELSNRLERIQRSSRNVPDKDWNAARARFKDRINEVEKRLLTLISNQTIDK